MADYVGAVDQGTTSTRFMIFDHAGAWSGWTRRSTSRCTRSPAGSSTTPKEIWSRTTEVIDGALGKAGLQASDLAAVGITNQRETTLVWDRNDR